MSTPTMKELKQLGSNAGNEHYVITLSGDESVRGVTILVSGTNIDNIVTDCETVARHEHEGTQAPEDLLELLEYHVFNVSGGAHPGDTMELEFDTDYGGWTWAGMSPEAVTRRITATIEETAND